MRGRGRASRARAAVRLVAWMLALGSLSCLAIEDNRVAGVQPPPNPPPPPPPPPPPLPPPPPPPPPSGSGAWLTEDFSSYVSTADLLADPRGIYSVLEDAAPAQITLDHTTGYGDSPQSMRYTFPDRSADTSGRCHDYPVGRNISFPAHVQQVWIEAYVKFSANFRTLAPGSWGCQSNAEYKFIFGRVTGGSRFNLESGTYGYAWTFGVPFDEQGNGGSPPKDIPGGDQVWDGQWHQYRLYLKVSSAPGLADGAAKFWLDGKLLKEFSGFAINASDIYGVALGRNMNQGPAQESYVWWGRISVWRSDPQF